MNKRLLLNKVFLLSLLSICGGKALSQLNPLTIGTINAGDSIVIYYDATINPSAGSQVSNQGTISGANFTAFVTNDPATITPNDATITPLNMFPLPVVLGQFKAYKKSDDIELTWQAISEINVSKYEIERSDDGRHFSKIGEVPARNGTGSRDYTFIDVLPLTAKNYYRLKMIDLDGKVKHSPVVMVHVGVTGQSLLVYPNPVKQKVLTLQLNNIPKGQYRLTIYNNAGQKIMNNEFKHIGGSASEMFNLPANVNAGAYTIILQSVGQINHSQVKYTNLLIVN